MNKINGATMYTEDLATLCVAMATLDAIVRLFVTVSWEHYLTWEVCSAAHSVPINQIPLFSLTHSHALHTMGAVEAMQLGWQTCTRLHSLVCAKTRAILCIVEKFSPTPLIVACFNVQPSFILFYKIYISVALINLHYN